MSKREKRKKIHSILFCILCLGDAVVKIMLSVRFCVQHTFHAYETARAGCSAYIIK